MPRSPATLPLLLPLLLGCGEEDGATRVEVAAETMTPGWFPVAPFHDDLRPPQASHARAWQPPPEGPVPVVEILRDGSYLVDGVRVEEAVESKEELDASTSLRWWLFQQAEAMPEKPIDPTHPRSPRVPANPVMLRVDREAPWKAVRTALWSCGLTGIELWEIDLAVEGPTPWLIPVVRLPLDSSIGFSNYGSGEPAYRIVWLEAGAPPLEAPVRLGFLASRTDDDRSLVELSEVSCSDVPAFAAALTDLRDWPEPPVSILFPEETPWWAALAALELALEAELDAPLGFDVSGDPLKEDLANLRAWIVEQREDSDR